MKTYFVYILRCSDNTYYTGITSNLDKRLFEHTNAKQRDSYTYSRRPVSLEYYSPFTNQNQAIDTEKKIKKWSRAKK